jgi:hypothetical protein
MEAGSRQPAGGMDVGTGWHKQEPIDINFQLPAVGRAPGVGVIQAVQDMEGIVS